MRLSLGIVGLPNVGKSTLFNALTRNNVLAANYPFATIEPNEGVVPLPDPRLGKLAELGRPASCLECKPAPRIGRTEPLFRRQNTSVWQLAWGTGDSWGNGRAG